MTNHAQHVPAIRQAKYAFEHKIGSSKETRVNRAVELAEWNLFSNAQISMFTGLRPRDVGAYTGKTDKTGGKLRGEALGLLLDLIAILSEGERSDLVLNRALEAGCSTLMLSRLTGLSLSKVVRSRRRFAAPEAGAA